MIIDGICLSEVLEKISMRVDSTVYVKHLSGVRIWHDGINLERYKAGNNINRNFDILEKCVFEYHTTYCPDERYHMVYEWKDD